MARPMRTAARDMTDPSGAGVALASSGVAAGDVGGNKTPREEKQGRCRSMGQRKWPATPLPEHGNGELQAA